MSDLPQTLRLGSVFSGIGGLDLGLEAAGFEVQWQIERDAFCRRVLARHWPTVQRYGDVRLVTPEELAPVDLICGGFPCQDISKAGLGAGLSGAKSGLWWEMFRLIQGLGPTWVVIENVPALRARGADDVIAALESAGYACWPLVVGAWAVGAPHRRDRVLLLAYREGERWPQGRPSARDGSAEPSGVRDEVSNAHRARLEEWWAEAPTVDDVHNSDSSGNLAPEGSLRAGWTAARDTGWWAAEPPVGRVVNGLPGRVDRSRAIGNAVVPQVACVVGEAILAAWAEYDRLRAQMEG